MSNEVRKAGFRIIAIDHEFNRHSPKVSLVSLDLAAPRAQLQIFNMLESLRPMALHMGLPCGTCSRARDRALPRHLQSSFRTPPPLRDARNLFGFGHLQGADLQKVQAANMLYSFAVSVLQLCRKIGIRVSVENPTRSWLWGILTQLTLQTGDTAFISWFSKLTKTTFHACLHGSRRNKQTSLLSHAGLFDSLAATCDGQHQHDPWDIRPAGRKLTFATAEEAAYSQLLCKRMASLLADLAQSLSISLHHDLSLAKLSKHATGRQTKAAPPIIPEFRDFHHSTSQQNKAGYR